MSRLPEGMPKIAGTEVKWRTGSEAYRKTKSVIPTDLDEKIVKKLQETALAAYQARPYQGRAVLFQAVGEERSSDGRWQLIFPGLRVERVPGDHFTMLQPPHVGVLTERLGRYLAESVTVDAAARTP